MTLREALTSTAIAFGLGIAGVAFAAYEFNQQLGGIFAAGFKPFIG